MLQDNETSSVIDVLKSPLFAKNLRRWTNEKKIKSLARSIDFTKLDSAHKALQSLVLKHPDLFLFDRLQGKSTWQICHKYYNRLASYVHKR